MALMEGPRVYWSSAIAALNTIDGHMARVQAALAVFTVAVRIVSMAPWC